MPHGRARAVDGAGDPAAPESPRKAREETMLRIEDQPDPPARPVRPQRTARSRRALGAAAVAAALAVSLTACGGGGSSTTSSAGTSAQTSGTTTTAAVNVADKSAAEVLAASQAAARAATSVRVAGDIDDVSLELRLARGVGATGSLEQRGSRFELIAVGGEVYLKGSDAFYEQIAGRAAVQLLGGKWLKAPASDREFASIAQLGDMELLLRQVLNPQSDTVVKGAVTTVDGQQSVPLRAKDGTLYVAAEGALPLQLTGSASRPGKITFSEWNQPVDVTAPTDAVDLSELKR